MAKKINNTLERRTVKRTIVNVRKTIANRLRSIGKSRLWLADKVGMRPATVYDFLNGRAAAKVETVERMMAVLGLEIRPKE